MTDRHPDKVPMYSDRLVRRDALVTVPLTERKQR